MLSKYYALLCVLSPTVISAEEQSILGPAFEKPTRIANETAFATIAESTNRILQDMFLTGKTPYGNLQGNDTALSVNMVSLDCSAPLFDYHFTPSTLNISAGSTSSVTADSIYRIGSISKLFTVYTLLVNGGRKIWDTPVTEFLSELKRFDHQNASAIDRVRWDTVTVGGIASQLGGIGRDSDSGDLATSGFPATAAGLPSLPPSEIPSCGENGDLLPCDRAEFFRTYPQRHPVYLSYNTPIYSNSGFRLLAYVIDAITRLSYNKVLQDTVLTPLGLGNTMPITPTEKGRGVIPKGDSGFFRQYGDEVATAGIYASSGDLCQFGKSILQSKQLSVTETLRWMKPQAHTSSLTFSVGAPWEIWRVKTGITSGRISDLYTKSGSVGVYNSLLILIPDYNVAISMLSGGLDSALALKMASETTIQQFVPIIESIARAQSCKMYCGKYVSSRTNSSLVLGVDETVSGLVVKEWISRGKDIKEFAQGYSDSTGNGAITNIRVLPTDLSTVDASGTNISYRAIIEALPAAYNPVTTRVFNVNASAWDKVDLIMYGNVAVDDFVFHLKSTGVADSVNIRVLRDVLHKVA